MTETRRGEKHYSNQSPDGPWDAIVIGSGMGGMTCAALLAKLGRRVLVLEQHFVPGGMTQTFRRTKWVWDVGVHVVGQTSERTAAGRLLAALTDGRLKWTSTGPVYDEFHFPGDFHIDFPDNPRQFKKTLLAAFPGELDAIEKYLALVKRTTRLMQGVFGLRWLPGGVGRVPEAIFATAAKSILRRTTKEVLDELTGNDRLKAVLAAQWGYYGAPPSQSAFSMHAMVVDHFFYGGTYPVGGAKSIADAFLKTIADAGGWTRCRAPVERILVEDRRAVGVRLEGGEEIRATRVVSAAGGWETVNRLLADAPEKDWRASVAALGTSPAHIALYLGFKGDIRAAGAGSANKWFYESWDHETMMWDPEAPGRIPCLYVSFPSLKDPEHDPGPELLHTGEVVTFVPYERFAQWDGTRWMKRGDGYAELKAKIQDAVLSQFLERMPGLRGLVAFSELSTPLSTHFFTRAAMGGIYGLEHTPRRFASGALRPRTPIRGLYLAGADVTSGGVMGAMSGGLFSAIAMEPMRSLRWLRTATAPRGA